tara:strand:- start:218 stop:997 length:780 start_codon:yes stop_codon:yes gene_type:complete
MIDEKKRRLPGVFLLPNLITTAALFCGFYSVIASINNDFVAASIAILIAMVLDGLDGRIARLTNTQTSFGEYFDSLSDMICFGLSPAILVYIWTSSLFDLFSWQSNKVSWILCFIYVASAAIRLARFNSKSQTQDKKYFTGLASPAAAAVIITFIWMIEVSNLNLINSKWLGLFVLLALSFLMISNITYYSFKEFDIRHKVPHIFLFIISLVISFISFDPPLVLFSFFILYALSGPSMYVIRLLKKKKSLTQEKKSPKF